MKKHWISTLLAGCFTAAVSAAPVSVADFEKAPAWASRFGKVVPGGLKGSALEAGFIVRQGKLSRSGNFYIPLAVDAGKYCFSGAVKGEFASLWASVTSSDVKGKKSTRFNIRKEQLKKDAAGWYHFRLEFTVPQKDANASMLFQVYGTHGKNVLLDEFILEKL